MVNYLERETIINTISDLEINFKRINKILYENPEISGEEERSSEILCDFLEENGFTVEKNFMNIKYAFRASLKSKISGAKIAFLAEYDALPKVGHACGHNLIGLVSCVAGIALGKVIDEIGGTIYIYGCPAEETDGAKVELASKGAFESVDVAMMVHPESRHYKSGKSLAMEALKFEFYGKTAHASVSPETGINALDAVIGLFNNINQMRQHVLPDSKIHGVIKNGGEVANVIPDYSCAEFYVRAKDKAYLIELSERVKNCAKASSLATGAKLKITNTEATYDNMITNERLSKLYTDNLKLMGCTEVYEPRVSMGSLDMGSVSQVCPSIHPYFSIIEGDMVPTHTRDFADATVTEYAISQSLLAAKALALSGLEIIKDQNVLKEVNAEFNGYFNNVNKN